MLHNISPTFLASCCERARRADTTTKSSGPFEVGVFRSTSASDLPLRFLDAGTMAQQPFRMVRGRAACGVQQSHGRGACVAAVDSSWHGMFVVSVLFLGGLAGSRRCPQRHGATAQCFIIVGILVATSNSGRSSVAASAATRASTILQADPRTVEPSPCDSDCATGKIAQALGPERRATATGGRASSAVSLDPTSMDLLAKVSELEHRLTARLSLGGLLADRGAVRSGVRSRSLAARNASESTTTVAASPMSPTNQEF